MPPPRLPIHRPRRRAARAVVATPGGPPPTTATRAAPAPTGGRAGHLQQVHQFPPNPSRAWPVARSATEVPTNATSTATTGSAPRARDGMSASSTEYDRQAEVPRGELVGQVLGGVPAVRHPGPARAATNCSTPTTPITIRHSPSDRILAQELVRPLHQRGKHGRVEVGRRRHVHSAANADRLDPRPACASPRRRGHRAGRRRRPGPHRPSGPTGPVCTDCGACPTQSAAKPRRFPAPGFSRRPCRPRSPPGKRPLRSGAVEVGRSRRTRASGRARACRPPRRRRPAAR